MGISLKIFRSRRCGYEDIASQCVQTIKIDAECTIVCTGYKKEWTLTVLQYFFCVVFFGVPYLFLRWYPGFEAYFFWKRCELEFAQVVLVKDQMGGSSLHPVHDLQGQCNYLFMKPRRYFVYKLQRFIWCSERVHFTQLRGLADGVNTFNQILHFGSGQAHSEKQERSITYGRNTIDVDLKSYWRLLGDEILNPFYVFEALSITLWVFDEYYFYAVFIVIVSIISVHASVVQTKKQCIMVHDMVSSVSKLRVVVHTPDSGSCEQSSEDLVPGDVIEIPSNGCVMMCDALLLSGTCIVNESSLTGESLPVTKVPPVYTDEIYMPNSLHMRHTLYCGTQILQTRYYENNKILAIVTATGSNTAKGQLVRSILYPKSMAFDFMIESIKFIIILFGVATIAMAYSTYLYILRDASLETLLLRTLDLITIVVPPTLPAAMTIGSYYSQKRLKKKGIFCISPSRIIVSGKTDLVCFDKTGTITEEGMDVWGLLPVYQNSGVTKTSMSSSRPPPLLDADIIHDIKLIDDRSVIKSALAACHSLTLIDNQICGEPIDVTMFKATHWVLEEPPGKDTAKFDRLDPTIVRPREQNILDDCYTSPDFLETCFNEQIPYEIGLIRQFPFTSSTQNMTVICRILGARNMVVFSKGAPEKMVCLCSPNTIPENIRDTLSRFTLAGFRVIALACKEMPKSFTWAQSQRIPREQIEKDLIFIGLLLMQNNLKQQSELVISQLKQANIKCIMATGDNIMTAVSVSRGCGILPGDCQVILMNINESSPSPQISIESLSGKTKESVNLNDASVQIVMEGNTWSVLKEQFPMYFEAITIKTAVFARMSPQQKTLLIETLQQLDYYVTMCGDGANDCGALKAAHVGISLSRTEASIVAPFTSREGSVMCVPELIKEGRCALVTSFGLFNYMAMYSLIQFFSVIILYSIGAEIGTNEFLYVDLILISSLVMSMGSSGPSGQLINHQPTASLLSLKNVIPLLFQTFIVFLFQISSLHLLYEQSWYVPVFPAKQDEEVVLCWENTVVYSISCFQFLIFAFLYSRGRQHRESVHRNWLMLVLLILLSSFTAVLFLFPPDFLSELFEVEQWNEIDSNFRIMLIIMPAFNFFISYVIEVLFNKRLGPRLLRSMITIKHSKMYKTIENELYFGIKLNKSSISCDRNFYS